MTRDEAIERLNIHKNTSVFVDSIAEAIDMAIEALSAEEAVWNEYEAEFTDLPDIPRYYYEKVVGNMAHEINVLKEQLESANAEQGVGRYENAMQKLREMPRYLNGVKEKQITKISADAVQGEWIDVKNEPYCECSVCGSYIDNLDDDYAFCPRCGARMIGGDTE